MLSVTVGFIFDNLKKATKVSHKHVLQKSEEHKLCKYVLRINAFVKMYLTFLQSPGDDIQQQKSLLCTLEFSRLRCSLKGGGAV